MNDGFVVALLVGVALFVVRFFIAAHRRTSRPFWKLVAKHPNEAYQWFSQEKDIWIITRNQIEREVMKSMVEDNEAIGPYQVAVPELEQVIQVFARLVHGIDLTENSRKRFCEQYGQRDKNA